MQSLYDRCCENVQRLQCENKDLKDTVKYMGSKMVPNFVDKSRRMHVPAFESHKQCRMASGSKKY